MSDDDRVELAGRLAAGLPATPTAGQAVADLRLLLVRRTPFPNLERHLLAELARRVPKEIGDGEPPEACEVDLSDLLPAEPLRSRDELRAWLATLEARIGEMLRSGAPVRLKVGP